MTTQGILDLRQWDPRKCSAGSRPINRQIFGFFGGFSLVLDKSSDQIGTWIVDFLLFPQGITIPSIFTIFFKLQDIFGTLLNAFFTRNQDISLEGRTESIWGYRTQALPSDCCSVYLPCIRFTVRLYIFVTCSIPLSYSSARSQFPKSGPWELETN